MLYVIIDGEETLVNKNLNSETNEMTIETLKAQITNLEAKIENVESEIKDKHSEIDNFEYECSESEFDEILDEIESEVTVCGMTFYPSDILKSCDPVAYRCGKSGYESSYDLDNCEEYTNLQDELSELTDELDNLQDELSELTDELDNLESEES